MLLYPKRHFDYLVASLIAVGEFNEGSMGREGPNHRVIPWRVQKKEGIALIFLVEEFLENRQFRAP
jgi:hypothetical protein